MSLAFNIFALAIVGLFAAVYVAALVVQVRQRLEIRAERRAAAADARDFAATDRAGYVQRATWEPKPRPALPDLPKEQP